MKKRILFFLIMIMAISLSGCGSKEDSSQKSKKEDNLLKDAIASYPDELKNTITSCTCTAGDDGCLYTEIIMNDLKQYGSVVEKVVQSINDLSGSYSSYSTRIMFQGPYFSYNWRSEDNKTGTIDSTLNGEHSEGITVQQIIDFCNTTDLTGEEKTPTMIFEEAMDNCPDKDSISSISASSTDMKFYVLIEVNNADKFDDILRYSVKAYQDNLGGYPCDTFSVSYSENGETILTWMSEDGYVGSYTDMRTSNYIPNYEPK